MSASIEWGSASSCRAYVLGPHEEAGDNQTPSENFDDGSHIGLMFDDGGGNGYCLTGTPEQITRTLTTAIGQVVSYQAEQQRSEAAHAEAQELHRTIGSVLEAARGFGQHDTLSSWEAELERALELTATRLADTDPNA